MDRFAFEQLCREASLALGIHDTAALGQGDSVLFEEVVFETAFRPGRGGFVLMAELGTPAEHARTEIYESLLTMQVLTWNQPGMRFGFNPKRQSVVLCIDARPGPRADGAWLAALVRGTVTHAQNWRETLLAGEFGAPDDRGDAARDAMLAQLMAQSPLVH